jgi:hypothetical protein
MTGNGDYPHVYRNDEGDINNYNGNCKKGDMWEFPIMDDRKVYDGTRGPGKDRVLYVHQFIKYSLLLTESTY